MSTTISTPASLLKKGAVAFLVVAATGISYRAFQHKNDPATQTETSAAQNQEASTTPNNDNGAPQKNVSPKAAALVTATVAKSKPTPANNPKNKTSVAAVKQPTDDYANLKNLLQKKGIYFGTYLNNDDIAQLPPRPSNYLATISKYFSLYSIPAWFHHTEYSGRGVFNFNGPDQVADFAVKNGAKMHAHNLIYNVFYPPWLAKGDFTPAELADILKTHVQTVVRHYRDKYPGSVIAWDAVNEPVADPYSKPQDIGPTGLRNTKWSVIHKPGSTDPSDYIALTFQWAHEADPNVKLYINEGGIEFKGHKWDVLYTLIKKLKADNVPISGVGFQCHFDTHYEHPLTELQDNMDMLADLGLQSQVTELDCVISTAKVVPWSANAVSSPGTSDIDKQTQIFKGTLRAALNAKNCNAFIMYGAFDPVTCENKFWKDKSGKYIGPFFPNILDDQMRPKRNFKALVDEVKSR
ncbi:MAG: Beta-xylanase [Mucilaginibacter sp.]|nr:Beta-xylanase [Mucilaginibacter sp.]